MLFVLIVLVALGAFPRGEGELRTIAHPRTDRGTSRNGALRALEQRRARRRQEQPRPDSPHRAPTEVQAARCAGRPCPRCSGRAAAPGEVVGFVPDYYLSFLTPGDFADVNVLLLLRTWTIGLQEVLSTPPNFVALRLTGAFGTFSRRGKDEPRPHVLLTLSAFAKQHHRLTRRRPLVAANRLVLEVAPLLHADGFAGVDMDVEGHLVG